MKPDSENFDALRRLLALKRHEQPPPGYFNRFPGEVMARIRAGETGEPDSIIGRLFGEAAWWWRLRAALEARPAFAGAFGAAVCALLISGVVYSENSASPGTSSGLMASDAIPAFTPATMAMNQALDQSSVVSSATDPMPIQQQAGSLFDQVPFSMNPQVVPVSEQFRVIPGN